MSENENPAPEPAGEPSTGDLPVLPPTPPEPPPDAERRSAPWQAKVVVSIAVALALVALFWPRSQPKRDLTGGMLADADGQPRTLAGELAPVTLVHFWASWCPPCIDEIPLLTAFAGELGDERFRLLLVAVADERAKAERLLGASRFPLYLDPNWELAHRFATDKLPETHLVVGGEIVASFIGATDWRDPAVRQKVSQALAGL